VEKPSEGGTGKIENRFIQSKRAINEVDAGPGRDSATSASVRNDDDEPLIPFIRATVS
jgi:hypothetical protein